MGRAVQAYDEDGAKVWQTDYDIYGNLRNLKGDRNFIPFRQLGQIEDEDIELYLNGFRYYDYHTGLYISQDPIGLAGNNPTLYAYVKDANIEVDIWGLDCGRAGKQSKLKSLIEDKNTPRNIKGWIKQELNAISRGNRKTIRNPKGYELAHKMGMEAAKGFGYEHSNLQLKSLHKLQHKFDNFGRKNKKIKIKI